jgi:hypothetical protein
MQMSTHAACLSAARSACVWASHPPRYAEAIARWCHCCTCSCDLLRVVGELQPRALLCQQAAHATSFAAIFALVRIIIVATSSHLAGSCDRLAPPCKELISARQPVSRPYLHVSRACGSNVAAVRWLCKGAGATALSAALTLTPRRTRTVRMLAAEFSITFEQ